MAERDGTRVAGRVGRAPATLLAMLAAGALLVLLASTASARLIERHDRSAELGAPDVGAAKARCAGRARHRISGGFHNDSPWRHDANSTIAAFVSAPSGRRSWRVRAANFIGERETFTASVLCSRRDPDVKVRSEAFRVPPAEQAKATVRCPRRREAIAGGFGAPGFSIDAGPEVVAIESRRKGRRKWRVAAYNNSGTIGGRLVAYVSCAKRRPRLDVERVRGTAVDQAPLELAPRCERGSELWSGGFVADFQSFDPFALILADRSYPDRKRWVSRFVGMQTDGEVTALAYCRRR